jgi:carboxylesterase type B
MLLRTCVTLAVLAAASSVAQSSPAVTVKTKLGAVNGAKCAASNANAFLSIPYANLPTGDLRFAPPQPFSGAYPTGGLDATSKPPPCIQFGSEFLEPPPWSEDWFVQ